MLPFPAEMMIDGMIGGKPTPVFVSTGLVQNASASAALTLLRPASVLATDLLVAVMGRGNTATGTWTPPAGWTQVMDGSQTGGVGVSYAAGNVASLAFTHSSSANLLGGSVLAFRGAAFDVMGSMATGTAPSITVTENNSVLLSMNFCTPASVTFTSTPMTSAGWTFRSGNSDSTAPSWQVYSKPAPAGPTGSVTPGITGTQTNTALLSIKPL